MLLAICSTQVKKRDLKKEKKIRLLELMTSRPYFGHEKIYQVEHYFSASFLCRVIKG